jgi:CHAT domain-containing protein
MNGKTLHPLPFDPARAYRLYMALFSEVEDLIKGKHLLIVPSGALTQLPLQVLVTEPVGEAAKPSMRGTIARLFTFGRSDSEGAPASDRQGRSSIAWLARSHAVTVLPAVASLSALRRVGTPGAASRPMIGFGNPLLDGPDGSFADIARLAREMQSCGKPGRPLIAAATARGATVRKEDPGRGLAPYVLTSQPYVKTQVPLPETADELCAVAEDLKADAHDIRLGAQATEREVKRLSASGELAQYRMLHFATHGALAGELDAEPGLILTPPDAASAEDDGYLSASEIAGLKLDADWVILSACNTAAGGSATAEALSGLARAFIYAQARALLVSHWSVNSDSTVKLVTAAVREMARDAKVGRAEALRRAMLTLIDKGAPHEAHPAFWAPFVVVGEGAAPQSWR